MPPSPSGVSAFTHDSERPTRQARWAAVEIDDVGSDPLPAWPVLALFWGLPLWWLAGLFPLSPVIVAFPMLTLLIRKRGWVWVPGVLPWFAFVAWIVPTALMVDGKSALLGWGIRFLQFLAVGILMVYVLNARENLPARRLVAALSAFGAWVVVGGYLGMMRPYGRLTWTVGKLLPGHLTTSAYVQDLLFPPFAEVQTPYGASEPFLRPSAPFSYANGWGAMMAILVPVLVALALERRSRAATVWAAVVLVAAIPPALATSNRGLFLTFAVSVAYAAVRLAWRGRFRSLLLVLVLGAGLGLAVVRLGFFEEISNRATEAGSTTGRAVLYQETFQRALGSPFLGFGAPRDSYTSEVTVGTQGMLWNVMFCFGFVGLLFFAWFLLGAAWRTRPAPDDCQLWLHSVVVGSCLMCVFYGMDRQMVPLAVIVALLLRNRFAPLEDQTVRLNRDPGELGR